MANQIQLRGGTTAEHATFTGAVREVTVDTDKNTLVVHDGTTAGGHPLTLETPDPLGDWSITMNGTDLEFAYNGTVVFSLSSAGAVVAADNITAFGAP
jgi:hypothetical protein